MSGYQLCEGNQEDKVHFSHSSKHALKIMKKRLGRVDTEA